MTVTSLTATLARHCPPPNLSPPQPQSVSQWLCPTSRRGVPASDYYTHPIPNLEWHYTDYNNTYHKGRRTFNPDVFSPNANGQSAILYPSRQSGQALACPYKLVWPRYTPQYILECRDIHEGSQSAFSQAASWQILYKRPCIQDPKKYHRFQHVYKPLLIFHLWLK